VFTGEGASKKTARKNAAAAALAYLKNPVIS
jgi:dsRNA-specific ribonuclease